MKREGEFYIDRNIENQRLSLKQVKDLFLELYHELRNRSGYSKTDWFYFAESRLWKPSPKSYILIHLLLYQHAERIEFNAV